MSNTRTFALLRIRSLIRRPIKPKQIGRAPILGRPRLFGGKLLDYIQVTQQHIPLVISSCVSAINRLGLHNQVGASFDRSCAADRLRRVFSVYPVHKWISINSKTRSRKVKIRW